MTLEDNKKTKTDDKYDVAVDFDGVIHSYTSGFISYDKLPDLPNVGALEFLKELLKRNLRVAIMSTRASRDIGANAIYNYLLTHGMTKKEINQIKITNQKIHATLYIDDRGYQFNGTFPTIDYIENFQPWYKRGLNNNSTLDWEDTTAIKPKKSLHKPPNNIYIGKCVWNKLSGEEFNICSIVLGSSKEKTLLRLKELKTDEDIQLSYAEFENNYSTFYKKNDRG